MRALIYFILISSGMLINWGSTGHRALAEVASFYLTENAEHKINEILDGETIITASMYADDIKSDSRYDE